MLMDVSNRKVSVLRSGEDPVASVVAIDTKDRRGSGPETLVTAKDLLAFFPVEIRDKYGRLAEFSRIASNLSHFITVTSINHEEAVYAEGRSYKFPRKVYIKGEEHQLLFELKGTGYQWRVRHGKKPSHGFPSNSDNTEDSIYFNRSLGTVRGAESINTGLLSLANGLVLGLFYMYENQISLTQGLRYGGVTIPLAVRSSAEITAHVHSLDEYKEKDDFGIVVFSSPTFERQGYADLTEDDMRVRGRCIKFLLGKKVFYEAKSSHAQQFGRDKGAIFPVFDFGDMIFANRDIPDTVVLQSGEGVNKNFSRKDIWTYLTYTALAHNNVNDGITPEYEVSSYFSEGRLERWKGHIKVFFEELLGGELQQDQIDRLIELYPYCHKEMIYLIAEYFAEKEDSPLVKQMTETSKKILQSEKFAALNEFDLFGENELTFDEVSAQLGVANDPFYRQVKEYVLQGLPPNLEQNRRVGENSFYNLLPLIKRVNAIRKPLPTVSRLSIYTYVRMLVDTVREDEYRSNVSTVGFNNLSDNEVLMKVQEMLDSEYQTIF